MNLFFALFPAAATASEVQTTAGTMPQLAGLPIAGDGWLHLTVQFLGEYSRDLATAARGAAERVSAAPVTVELDCLRTFPAPGRRPVVLTTIDDNEPLIRLHEQLRGALAEAGVPLGPERPFVPHMTLCRADVQFLPAPWPRTAFTGHELVLARSGRGMHERIGSWPLRAPHST
jgi:2'-5' RNA ligase